MLHDISEQDARSLMTDLGLWAQDNRIKMQQIDNHCRSAPATGIL